MMEFISGLKSQVEDIQIRSISYCEKLPQLDEAFISVQNMLLSYKNNLHTDKFSHMSQEIAEVKNTLNVYIASITQKLNSLVICEQNYEEIIIYKNLADKLETINHYVDGFGKKVYSVFEPESNVNFILSGNINIKQKPAPLSTNIPLFFRK
jgi:hypothetical protein